MQDMQFGDLFFVLQRTNMFLIVRFGLFVWKIFNLLTSFYLLRRLEHLLSTTSQTLPSICCGGSDGDSDSRSISF